MIRVDELLKEEQFISTRDDGIGGGGGRVFEFLEMERAGQLLELGVGDTADAPAMDDASAKVLKVGQGAPVGVFDVPFDQTAATGQGQVGQVVEHAFGDAFAAVLGIDVDVLKEHGGAHSEGGVAEVEEAEADGLALPLGQHHFSVGAGSEKVLAQLGFLLGGPVGGHALGNLEGLHEYAHHPQIFLDGGPQHQADGGLFQNGAGGAHGGRWEGNLVAFVGRDLTALGTGGDVILSVCRGFSRGGGGSFSFGAGGEGDFLLALENGEQRQENARDGKEEH